MRNVYAWPPVGLTGWELHESVPISRSQSLFSGAPVTSSFQRPRRLATAIVPGIGKDQNGAGYVDVLKQLLEGGRHFVRVDCIPALWALAARDLDLRRKALRLMQGGTELMFSDGGNTLKLVSSDFALTATPTTNGGWPAIDVTGLPPNMTVARPSQRIRITASNGDTELVTVLAAAQSDGSGAATIRLLSATTLTGSASIGERESIVFEAMGLPRAVQPAAGTFEFTWNFREVFEDEDAEAWAELDPWP